jgi:hypothetical protein
MRKKKKKKKHRFAIFKSFDTRFLLSLPSLKTRAIFQFEVRIFFFILLQKNNHQNVIIQSLLFLSSFNGLGSPFSLSLSS